MNIKHTPTHTYIFTFFLMTSTHTLSLLACASGSTLPKVYAMSKDETSLKCTKMKQQQQLKKIQLFLLFEFS